MGNDRIPVNEPLPDGREAECLAECIRTGWIWSERPYVRSLQEKFACRVGLCAGTLLPLP